MDAEGAPVQPGQGLTGERASRAEQELGRGLATLVKRGGSATGRQERTGRSERQTPKLTESADGAWRRATDNGDGNRGIDFQDSVMLR